MSKILYIGNNIRSIKTGADSVNKRNIDFLERIFNEKLVIRELADKNTVGEKLNFYIGGLTKNIEKDILEILSDPEFEYVFLSDSLLGRIAKKIKRKLKRNIKVITFYHNIEAHYAEEFIKTSGFTHYPFYWAASFNESRTANYSDINIMLNNRDADELYKRYKIKTHTIIPVSYSDKFDANQTVEKKISPPVYLFVGVAFFANIEGVKWFIKNVLPFTPGTLKIIGKDMELHKTELQHEKVEVHGYVEDLAHHYYNSSLVIAPIFVGGGMKTKTAEALMYGKTIIGTQEAFQGYLKDNASMVECNNANDFIKVLCSQDFSPFNIVSRKSFENNYSNNIQFSKFKEIFRGK
jgi:hypothetical protein